MEFERAALSAFKAIWERDSNKVIEENKQKDQRNKPKNGLRVY
jgi:hypothetical protein